MGLMPSWLNRVYRLQHSPRSLSIDHLAILVDVRVLDVLNLEAAHVQPRES